MIRYNQNIGCINEEDQLLQRHLVEWKRMNKYHVKLCRKLSTTILSSITVYKKTVGQKFD
jgi:hypothetical protein